MKQKTGKLFSRKRTYSLRATLIVGIMMSTLILWGISFAITTFVSWNQTKDVLDEALVRSAQVLSQFVDRGSEPNRDWLRRGYGRVDLDEDHFYFQVISQGKVVAKSSRAPNIPFVQRFRGHKGFANIQINGDPWRVFVLQRKHSAYEIQVGHAVEMRHEFLEDLIEELVFAGLIVLLVSILFNALLVFFGLKPLTAISQQLSKLSPKRLTPISVNAHSKEIVAIEESLNMLLTNLEVARKHERQFTADASHELRTPLSAIQMKLQLLQRQAPELTGTLAPLQHDVRRATHLIEHLLILARLDPMSMDLSDELPKGKVSVDELFTEMIDAYQEDLNVKAMTVSRSMTDLSIVANHDLILVALKNIMGNAIKYSPEGTTITVAAKMIGHKMALIIGDSGTGVNAEELSRLSQRFYRILGTKETGSGLGLSIVKKIVELHQGELQFRSRPEYEGLEVTILLPQIE